MLTKWLRNLFGKEITLPQPIDYSAYNDNEAEYESDIEQFAQSGYKDNPIVYACVKRIASALALVPFHCYDSPYKDDRKILKDHYTERSLFASGIFSLIIEELASELLVFGNSYAAGNFVSGDSTLAGLNKHSPITIRAILNDNKTSMIGYSLNGKRVHDWDINRREFSKLLHVKTVSLSSDIYGMSPINPTRKMVNLYNNYTDKNINTLNNSGNPSGIIVLNDDSITNDEKTNRSALKSARGILKSGGWVILKKVKKYYDTKKVEEINYKEGFATAARVIALAIGVPPMLISIEGDNTYSNMKLGTEELWDTTVYYLAIRYQNSINRWLRLAGVNDCHIGFDVSETPINLKLRRYEDDLIKSDILTLNEKRAVKNYPPREGGNDVTAIQQTKVRA